MTNELKDVLKGAMFTELEGYFNTKADELERTSIDRSKNYDEQGKENHVNFLAAEAVRTVIGNLGKEINNEPTKKISYK